MILWDELTFLQVQKRIIAQPEVRRDLRLHSPRRLYAHAQRQTGPRKSAQGVYRVRGTQRVQVRTPGCTCAPATAGKLLRPNLSNTN